MEKTQIITLLFVGVLLFVMAGVLIFVFVFLIALPTVDYSDINANVKVQEVGIRYYFFNLGEQSYIRVQNAYSEQYSASSESYEVCIDREMIPIFNNIKNNRSTVNLRIKGNGFSTRFRCITGDKVIEIR